MKKVLLYIIALLTLSSCYRKPIYDEYNSESYAKIPININWSPSGITLQNVSVMVYDRASGKLVKEHVYEHNDQKIQSYIYLPKGEYTAVVFNEMRDQIDYVSVEGHENLSTLKFIANNDSKARARSLDGTDGYIQQPGDLAVSVIDDLDVTDDLVDYTNSEIEQTKVSTQTRVLSEKLMGVTPTRKTVRLIITMHVDMLCSALMPVLVDLLNVADGYYVASDKNTLNAKTVQFKMNNRIYDEGSDENGVISAELVIFGTLGERMSTASHSDSTPLKLDALFALTDADKSIANRVIDITNIVQFTDQENGSIIMKVECRADALPKVTPVTTGSESGFDTNLENWETVDVPLIL